MADEHISSTGGDGKRRVLIVDDDRAFAESLVDLLEPHGYQVAVAHSTSAARVRIKEFDAQVALLDIRMGRESGVRLISELKQVRPRILCLMVTAYAEVGTAIQALHEGAYYYLRKPLDPCILFATLDRAFGEVQLEREKTEAQESLKSERDKLQSLMDGLGATGIGVDVIGLDCRIVSQSQILRERFGDGRGKLCYETYRGFKEPCDFCRMTQAVESGEVQRYELIAGDGKDYELFAGPFRNPDGTVDKVAEVVVDITERKRAEERLRLLSSAMEQSSEGIAVSDLEGNLLFVNSAFATMHGYAPKELVGKHLPIFHTPEQLPSVEKANREVQETGGFSGEIPHVRRDGTVFPALMHNSLLHDAAGNTIRMIGTLRDITERKQAEEALRVSEERHRSLTDDVLDTSAAGIIILDAAFRVVWVNQALEHYFGLRRDEVLGKDKRQLIRESIRHRFENPDTFAKTVLATYDDNTYVERFECHVLGGGECEERWLEHRSQPIRFGLYAGGRIEHYYDITERKRAEEELERVNRELESKANELESIMYVASHDLWSPLVNIKGFSKELEQSCKTVRSAVANAQLPDGLEEQLIPILEESVPKALEFIIAGVAKMDTLLGGLLRLSRLGQASLQLEQLDMNAMLADIAKASEFQVRESGATLHVDTLPPCLGDATQINQVFSNLLDNALKYLDPIRSGVIRVSGQHKEGLTTYCVEDNGIGIAPGDKDKAFEAFRRLAPEGPAVGEGLGLATIRRILDRQEGKVWLESEPGKGTRFFVSLPAQAK